MNNCIYIITASSEVSSLNLNYYFWLSVAVDPAPGADAPADSPDGARAGMVQEANSTIADETHGPATSGGRRRKRKYAPGKTERQHRRWCSDNTVRAPLSDDAQAGGGGESGV